MEQLFSWLASSSSHQQIIMLLIVVIAFVIVLLVAIKTGIHIGSKDKLIKIGKVTEEIKKKEGEEESQISKKEYDKLNKTPHSVCPHSRDILIVINEANKIWEQKQYIIRYDQMKTQMNYAEQKCDQLRTILQKVYLSELEKQGMEKIFNCLSFGIYKLIIKELENQFLHIIRRSFHENHFDELNEKDFDNFSEDKSNYILAKMREILIDLYFYEENISLERIMELQKKEIEKIKNIVEDIFKYARSVAIDNKVKLLELDERLDNIIKKFIG